MSLEADKYYQFRSPSLTLDVADSTRRHTLVRKDCVLCIGFMHVDRKRHAILSHISDEGEELHLLYRVSRFNRGRGEWRELNPMLVIALADKLPTL